LKIVDIINCSIVRYKYLYAQFIKALLILQLFQYFMTTANFLSDKENTHKINFQWYLIMVAMISLYVFMFLLYMLKNL